MSHAHATATAFSRLGEGNHPFHERSLLEEEINQ